MSRKIMMRHPRVLVVFGMSTRRDYRILTQKKKSTEVNMKRLFLTASKKCQLPSFFSSCLFINKNFNLETVVISEGINRSTEGNGSVDKSVSSFLPLAFPLLETLFLSNDGGTNFKSYTCGCCYSQRNRSSNDCQSG